MSKFIQPIGEFCKGFLLGGTIVAGMIWAIVLLSGCSTHTISITPDCVNATSTATIYCPEATVIRVVDGNRTVDMVGESAGVGAVVTGVLKP